MKKHHHGGNNPIIFFVVIVLLFVIFFSGTKIIEIIFSDKQQVVETVVDTKTISRNGVDYFPRQDITVFLVIGIDENGPVKSSGSYNNSGEADMVSLVVFDETKKEYGVVQLNRDTIMDIPMLGIGGKPAGTMKGQLALAHTYGTGLEDSCENTVKAVSEFFYGLNIDYYLSMNMDAISILTDSVGGVKVTVEDDFSEFDSSIPEGETVLNGEQAVAFIQTRKGLGDQLNVSRMKRHESYMNGFMEAFEKSVADQGKTFVAKTYDKLEEYTVTDCSVTSLDSLLERSEDYEYKGVITPEGENVKGAEYMEFRVDEDKLDKFILDNFYSEK